MNSTTIEVPSLALEHCKSRQKALRKLLSQLELDAALLTDRRYVYWCTGYWNAHPLVPTAVLFSNEGPTTLVTHVKEQEGAAADEMIAYVPHRLCTLVEDLQAATTTCLQEKMQSFRRIGVVGSALPWLSTKADWCDVTVEFQYLRRKKYPDEVAAIRHSIKATESAYMRAKEILEPGLSELDLFAEMQAAATKAAGEPLTGWGNDFQCGTAGGPPRIRSAESGELAVLDIGVAVRGYRSDLCRTFAVNGNPTNEQQVAHQRIVDILEEVEQLVRPGVRCAEVFNKAKRSLDGWQEYSFFHHLGHGIGLDGHEVPRLNPHWDDVFQPGDLVAVEPGLYGDQLRGGIRLEQNFLVTDVGAERLSHYPLDL